ncbi:MAG TPA: hypothetical protein PLF06_02780 [Syntrophales bacterium]|nr:hypothetical protein [Syntrophales bacterium]HPV52619.1 hypothetical protein [Syntrophales bacterium]HPX01097.1 hypothetical protein [Syntrophales bacterium]HQC22493.1 hypothetical protein [Syntrophales bacterium]
MEERKSGSEEEQRREEGFSDLPDFIASSLREIIWMALHKPTKPS